VSDERPLQGPGSGPEPGPGRGPEPGLDPVEDERLRGLLADVGSPALPEDVAARLEDTLAGLVAQRQEAGAPDGAASERVVPLRRRWAKVGTIAAAAVIVAGAGGVAVNELVQGQVSADSATAGRAESGAEEEGDAGAGELAQSPAPQDGSQDESQDGARDRAQDPSAAESLARDLPAVSSRAFSTDVTRLLGTPNALRAVPEQDTQKSAPPPAECPGPVREDTTTLPVRYDGALAALVVHPTEDGRRLVEAWDCSGGARLAFARVAPRH